MSVDSKTKKIPGKVQKIIDAAIANPEKYKWLYEEEDEQNITNEEYRKKPRKSFNVDESEMKNLLGKTFLDDCLENKFEFYNGPGKEATEVYILGTDHELKYSEYSITTIFDDFKPDILAMEECLDHTIMENHEKMMEIMRRNKGSIESIIKNETVKTLKQAILLPCEDEHEDQGKLLISWGHLNNIDSLVPYYLVETCEWDCEVKELDVSEFVFDNKLEGADYGIVRSEAVKYLFGFDCDLTDPMIDADAVMDLIEAGNENPDLWECEVCRQAELQYNKYAYILETHIRDIFMAGRLQHLCARNPGKRILVLCGADHVWGMRRLFHRRIPQALSQIIQNSQKSRKQLWKKIKKYGCDRDNLLNFEKLPLIGVRKD